MPGFNLTRPAAACLREKLNLTPEEEEIALFGLQTITYPTVGFLCILFAGWLLGCLQTALAAAVTAFSLRLFSGGAHARSPLTCILLGMIITPLLGKAAALTAPLLSPSGLGLIIAAGFLPSLALFWRLAPVDSPAKPVAAPEQRRKLRFLSVTGVLLITAAQFVLLLKGQDHSILLAMSLGLWWQAFTLTRSGHRFAAFTDDIMKKGGVTG